MNTPKAVSQRYFVTHIKELSEPVEVTIQSKNGSGTITTLGYFFPVSKFDDVVSYVASSVGEKGRLFDGESKE